MLPDEIFTGDFASWTVHFVNTGVENQQDGNVMPKPVGPTIYN
jgi:hypothetical protein